MLHVYHYLTNIINQTVLPLYKKAGGNDFLRLLPIVCYWYLFDNTTGAMQTGFQKIANQHKTDP